MRRETPWDRFVSSSRSGFIVSRFTSPEQIDKLYRVSNNRESDKYANDAMRGTGVFDNKPWANINIKSVDLCFCWYISKQNICKGFFAWDERGGTREEERGQEGRGKPSLAIKPKIQYFAWQNKQFSSGSESSYSSHLQQVDEQCVCSGTSEHLLPKWYAAPLSTFDTRPDTGRQEGCSRISSCVLSEHCEAPCSTQTKCMLRMHKNSVRYFSADLSVYAFFLS